eukprot:Hpha_TRINITY_DN10911_c0_g1::TRINITY_DN10911_c0_g1_i1::g.26732::m.26732
MSTPPDPMDLQLITAAPPELQTVEPRPYSELPRHKPSKGGVVAAAASGKTCVLAAMGLSLTVDKQRLEDKVEATFDCKVKSVFSHWDRATLLIEVSPAIDLDPRVRRSLDSPRCFVMLSSKPAVVPVPESEEVNLRAYVLDPMQDYAGTPEQVARVRRLRRGGWAANGMSSKADSVRTLAEMVESVSSVEWQLCRCPNNPFQVIELSVGRLRLRAQLFFTYNRKEDAATAVRELEGQVVQLGILRVVLRADFFQPGYA